MQIAISLSCYPCRVFPVGGPTRKLISYFPIGDFNFHVGLVTLREIRFSSSEYLTQKLASKYSAIIFSAGSEGSLQGHNQSTA